MLVVGSLCRRVIVIASSVLPHSLAVLVRAQLVRCVSGLFTRCALVLGAPGLLRLPEVADALHTYFPGFFPPALVGVLFVTVMELAEEQGIEGSGKLGWTLPIFLKVGVNIVACGSVAVLDGGWGLIRCLMV